MTKTFDIADIIDITDDVDVIDEIDAAVAIKFDVEIMSKKTAKAVTFNFKTFLIQNSTFK